MPHPPLDRRRFVLGTALALPAAAGARPAQAQSRGLAELSGPHFDLVVDTLAVNITGRPRTAVAMNGRAPGPTLRFRQGETVTLNLTNRLKAATSIHWHGLRLPADMDGVPGLSFRGIMPGETFRYRFPVTQSGTYWWHSHSGMQEQVGLHGALVLEPAGVEAHPADREHVILLADWTDEDPMTVVANLKQQGDYYNFGQRTVGDLAHDLQRDGLAKTWRDRSMWAGMRMTPTDILDVSGATYTYLVNGAPPRANWTGLFRPGERVKLRIINGSAMTIFDVRIPGLKLSVVATDGCDVKPVEVDQLRIGTAETYDVIVTPADDRAYTLFAQAMDRSGYARATLAPREGMVGEVPPVDPRPVRTMADMGMGAMAGMEHGAISGLAFMPAQVGGMTPPPRPAGEIAAASGRPMGGMAPHTMASMGGASAGADVAAMAAPSKTDPRSRLPVRDASGVDPAAMRGAVNVDNVAMETRDKLADPGAGLAQETRRTLLYTDLEALQDGPDPRPPTREVVFHLTGNMQRWTWGFDGRKFSQAPPVRLKLGERVRIILVNDTMMEHPIHLHGLFSELENGHGRRAPLKHTVLVKPGERMSYLVSADTPGRWAFHCHLLYHMETGMFRTVLVS